jgi:sugar-phosphatase
VTAARSFSCKAILFDLDGVLVNSAECVERTWRVWAARHHLDAEKVISFAHGRRTIETVQLVAPELSADEELRDLESSEAMTAEGVYQIAGARALLESLPGDRWAVVTSGVRAVAEFRIRLTGLPTPAVMICADDIDRGKPHPQGYLKAAAKLGQSPADCLVIEDAPAGIEAAHNGGMRAIAIATTYARDRLLTAEAVVDRLADLAVHQHTHGLVVAARSD